MDYKDTMLELSNTPLELDLAVTKIAKMEREIFLIKEKEAQLRDYILNEMEQRQITKLDSPQLTIQYIAPTYREVFDAKEFKKDYPNMYDQYIKISEVKSSVRFKLK